MTVTQRIFELAQQQNISLSQLSRNTGIPIPTLSSWKKRNTCPSSDKLNAIAKCLNVSINELLGVENNINTSINTEVFVSGNCCNGKAELSGHNINVKQTIFSNPAVSEAYDKLSEKSKLEVQIYILDKAAQEGGF